MKKIAVIGFGEMGKRHAKDMEELSRGEIEVAAVFEPDSAKYNLGCQWMNKQALRFDSIEKMLESVKPDGAIISSPNFCHLAGLLKFKGRQIPLIIEKPLDSTFEKICEIVRFAHSYEAPIMVHHVMRYAPIVMKAKEIIGRGELGRICSFAFSQNIFGSGIFHNFRRNMKTGGGQLIEKATHDLDVLLHWCNAAPARVAAICKQQFYGGAKSDDLHCRDCAEKLSCKLFLDAKHSAGGNLKDVDPSNDLCAYAKAADIYDNETCLIELEDGTFGTYSNNFFAAGYYSRLYEIIGSRAIMRVAFTSQDKSKPEGEICVSGLDGSKESSSFAYHGRIHYNGSPNVVKHFYNLMSGLETKPYSPVDQAFAAEMISLSAYKANETKNFVSIADEVPDDIKSIFKNAFSLSELNIKREVLR